MSCSNIYGEQMMGEQNSHLLISQIESLLDKKECWYETRV